MRLVLEGDTVKFEPDFKDFEVFIKFNSVVYQFKFILMINPIIQCNRVFVIFKINFVTG